MDFYQAYNFIKNHPSFLDDFGCAPIPEIDVVKVNPKTEEIDDDTNKNTATRVWLEHGPYVKLNGQEKEIFGRDYNPSHDIELDCGAETFEEAIIELAYLILQKYGDY